MTSIDIGSEAVPLATPSPGNHWLQEWIDEFEITQANQVYDRLRFPGAGSRLYEIASRQESLINEAPPAAGLVVAGPGLDHKFGMCISGHCRNEIADAEIGKVLHYFDSVVMEGPPSIYYSGIFELGRTKDWFHRFSTTLEQDVAVLLHLKDIGALPYITFAQKPTGYSEDEQAQFAEEIGRPELASDEAIESLAREVSRAGGVEVIEVGPRRWLGQFRDPLFRGMGAHTFNRKTRPKKYEVAEELITTSFTVLLTDVMFAREIGAPVTSVVQPKFYSQPSSDHSSSVDEVALAMRIPTFERLNTRQVIELREEHPEQFERFRVVLQRVIKETIDRSATSDARILADVVWREQVMPEVADIERRIKAGRTTLASKAAAGISIGATVAAIGAVSTLPYVVTAGLALAVSPLAELYKYFDSRQTTRMSDFYFLWKADREHNH